MRVTVTFGLPKGGELAVTYDITPRARHERTLLISNAARMAQEPVANVLRIELDGATTFDPREDLGW